MTSGLKSQLFSPKRDFTERLPQKVSRNDSLQSKRSTGDPQDALFRPKVTFWSKSHFWDTKVTFRLKSAKKWKFIKNRSTSASLAQTFIILVEFGAFRVPNSLKVNLGSKKSLFRKDHDKITFWPQNRIFGSAFLSKKVDPEMPFWGQLFWLLRYQFQFLFDF